LGLLSGLTGTGGGIFLTPLLLFMHWARTKEAAAVSALFILVNRHWPGRQLSSTRQFPSVRAGAGRGVAVGGAIGSYFGSRRFEPT
jgi:uncharacterized membrane protein YfcA